MLDGDNELLPNGANLLLDALKPESKAAFAYGFLAVEENGVMLDIMSFLPWDAQLFSKLGNYIDALAIVDREIVIAHGGYAESLTLYGWEDFDLWARLAEGKYTAAGVRNFVGKYHRNPVSMISATNIDTSDALATIKSRAPSLFL
jgi:hypothetical protein